MNTREHKTPAPHLPFRAVAVALAFTVAATVAAPSFAEPTGTPAPSPSPTQTAPAVKPRPDPSAIDVPVDPETARFRARLAELQSQADALQAQLDSLDNELSIAAEAYNGATVRLGEVQAKLESTKVDLANAKEAYALQQELLARRADAIYREGDFAAFEMLLGSKSVNDLVARAKFLRALGMKDAQIAETLSAQKDQVASNAAQLEAAQTESQALEFELKARKIEIEHRIDEREKMLATVNSEVLDLMMQEAARRNGDEQVLLAQILAGAADKGVQVVPGSPVETALAYHGVPYLWGGSTPQGFDCSGLIMYVMAQHGVQLPHYSGYQFLMGEKVEPADLQPGDVVFFGSPIHHVGMYIGGGYFIHAPRTGDFVKVSLLSARKDYAGARRYPWQPRTTAPAGLDQLSPNVDHGSGVQLNL